MNCCNFQISQTILLGCSWQWSGMSIRLALQLGLHQANPVASTHGKKEVPQTDMVIFTCKFSNKLVKLKLTNPD